MSVQSSAGWIERASPVTMTGDLTILIEFRYTGACANSNFPVALQGRKTPATATTVFELFQYPPNDATNPNKLEFFWRDSGGSGHDDMITGNGDYYNQWIHAALTINGTTGAGNVYILKEGFNPLSPSYLHTVSLGNVRHDADTLVSWNENPSDPSVLGTNIQIARILVAQFTATEAQVLAQFAQQAVTAAFSAVTYNLLAMAAAASVNTDTGSAAHNWTIPTGGFSTITSKPSEWASGTNTTLTAAAGSFSMTGNAVTLKRARTMPAAQGTFTLTGNTAGLAKGRRLTATAGTFALTGFPGTSFLGYTVTAAPGAFALTGQPAAMRRALNVPCVAGAFTLSGATVGLSRGRPLAAAAGSFALTGNPVGLKRTRAVVASVGSFTLTGNAATLTKSGARVLTAGPGTFTITGVATGLGKGRTMPAAAGTFALTGNATTLRKGRSAVAAAGAFALTGQPTTLRRSTVADCAAGSFTLTGVPAGLTVQHAGANTLAAGQGTFTLTGQPASMRRALHQPAAAGAFALTGAPLTLARGRSTVAVPGAFSMTGDALAFALNRRLPLAAGTFMLTGVPASLTKHVAGSFELTAGAGAFTMTGGRAQLILRLPQPPPERRAQVVGGIRSVAA